MSTEIQPSAQYVNPNTGEALTLASPDDDLGRLVDDLRAYKREIDETIKVVSRELLSRMDQRAKWTIRGDGVTLTGASPKPEEQFDGPALFDALTGLIREGVLTHEARHAAVETEITYKIHKRGINALRALGGRPKEAVDSCATEVEKNRYVSVSRS